MKPLFQLQFYCIIETLINSKVLNKNQKFCHNFTFKVLILLAHYEYKLFSDLAKNLLRRRPALAQHGIQKNPRYFRKPKYTLCSLFQLISIENELEPVGRQQSIVKLQNFLFKGHNVEISLAIQALSKRPIFRESPRFFSVIKKEKDLNRFLSVTLLNCEIYEITINRLLKVF